MPQLAISTVAVSEEDMVLPGAAPAEIVDLLDVDDATLALALKAGDPRAATVAWLRFAPLVLRILQRTLGPHYDAEAVQQDIFLAFFSKVPELRQPTALRAFLISITARTIKHQLRRAKAHRIMFFWQTPEALDPLAESPDHEMAGTLAAFYSVLDSLNAQDRMLFALRFLEELDLKAVAATMGISVSTAKRHLARVWRVVAKRIRNHPDLIR